MSAQTRFLTCKWVGGMELCVGAFSVSCCYYYYYLSSLLLVDEAGFGSAPSSLLPWETRWETPLLSHHHPGGGDRRGAGGTLVTQAVGGRGGPCL